MAYRTRGRLGVDVLRFRGDLSTDEMVRMKSCLARLLRKKHKKLLIDLGAARHVELAGLGMLVDRLLKVRAEKGDIKLCNLRPEVEQTFRMIGVSGLMEAFASEEEAIQSFAA
jgi:anti-anti-sigma factor